MRDLYGYSMGALIIRIEFWGPFYYFNEGPPKIVLAVLVIL